MAIKSKLSKVVTSVGMWPRVKHYRGHGIHSPFTYSLVRNVLMQRTLLGDDFSVYYAMQGMGMTKKASLQVQNLYQYLDFGRFEVDDRLSVEQTQSKTLHILSLNLSQEQIMQSLDAIKQVGGTAVVIVNRTGGDRRKFLTFYCSVKEFLSVDNRSYFLCFFDGKYPKQHYKL